MATTVEEIKKGYTTTDETYLVFYDEHEDGSPGGFLVREGLERAERSASLMDQCGYRRVNVRAALDLNE